MVIDCDSHVMEPADLWQTYLEPSYRDRAIRIERRDGVDRRRRGRIRVGGHDDRSGAVGGIVIGAEERGVVVIGERKRVAEER